MKILIYCLIVLAAGLALLSSGLFLLLGWMFQSSPSSSDAVWGWGFVAFGLLYLAHPYLIYWLFGKGFLMGSMLVALFFIACSVGLLLVLPGAIEAAARP